MKIDDIDIDRLTDINYVLKELPISNICSFSSQNVSKVLEEYCLEDFKVALTSRNILLKISQFLKGNTNEFDIENPSQKFTLYSLSLRINEHIKSILSLISQGYNVDSFIIARQILEDTLAIICLLDNDFFNYWKSDDAYINNNKLKNKANLSDVEKDLYDMLYKSTSKMLHPYKESLVTMHCSILKIESPDERIRSYIYLINQIFNFINELLISRLKNYLIEQSDSLIKLEKQNNEIKDFLYKIKK